MQSAVQRAQHVKGLAEADGHEHDYGGLGSSNAVGTARLRSGGGHALEWLICAVARNGLVGARSAPNRPARIAAGGQAAWVTLSYPESGHQFRELRYLASNAGSAGSPQKPHNFAARRRIPTGSPRTERHTPVHLLCV